jgi:hypothetical protein
MQNTQHNDLLKRRHVRLTATDSEAVVKQLLKAAAKAAAMNWILNNCFTIASRNTFHVAVSRRRVLPAASRGTFPPQHYWQLHAARFCRSIIRN